MLLKDYMDLDRVFPGLKPADKPTLLKMLAEKAAACLPRIEEKELHDQLKEREAQATTGIGLGVAIPHAFLDGVERMTCFLAQIPEGVDFAAVDKAKVYIVFLIVSPPGRPGSQIKMLAHIARVMSRPFIQQLAEARDGATLFNLVVEEDSRHV